MASTQPIPGITIEEALDRYLALVYPSGPPDGVDPSALLGRLREVIARDRPEWAGSSPQAPTPASATYAERKAQIVADAQREDVPTDPEDRFFYERASEAAAHRDQRRAEEREDRIREDLRRRLAAEHKASDPATIERVLRIRHQLEERIRQAAPQPARLDLAAPAIEPIRLSPPAVEPSPVAEPDALAVDDAVEAVRAFNEARRSRLRPREEHLSPRRPEPSSRRREPLAMEPEPEPPSGLAIDEARPGHRRQPLRLE